MDNVQQLSQTSRGIKALEISSVAFKEWDYIPPIYTTDGKNINPPLVIQHIPPVTKSLVVIMEDLTVFAGTGVHWIVWNIPPSVKIKERNSRGVKGKNDLGELQYIGPCALTGTHRYSFKVYALDDMLNLGTGTDKIELQKAMNAHIIGFGKLVGLYKKELLY